jgi:hypothetical protein
MRFLRILGLVQRLALLFLIGYPLTVFGNVCGQNQNYTHFCSCCESAMKEPAILNSPPETSSSLRHLRSFSLAHHPDITDAGLESALTYSVDLEEVELRECPLLGDQTLAFLSRNCPRLRKIYWIGVNSLTRAGIEALARLPRLHVLNFSSAALASDACRTILTQCTQLRFLDLSFCPVQDEAFDNVQAPLQFLNLQGCSLLTHKTLDRLAYLPHLRHLALAYQPSIDPAALARLSLQTLRLAPRFKRSAG